MFALLAVLVPLAFAGRIDRVNDMAAAGDNAGVIETVGKWEAAGSLGDEKAALVALRDQAALNLALAARTPAALRVFRMTYADSALVPTALKAEQDLAFEAAQDEGTSAALRGFLADYPANPHRAQALILEDGLAFQEAASLGTAEAIAEFRRYHPSSPYLPTAWEALAAHTPGITLLLPDGTAYLLPDVAVTDGHVPAERSPALASARPWVAVNVPGTGRGASSDWWGLYGVGDDGTLLATSPLGAAIAHQTGSTPPGMLDLVAASGAHSARVAGPSEPLVATGTCIGTARFAFVLTSPDGGRRAWTFGVPCDAPAVAHFPGQTAPAEAAGPDLLLALTAAEAGDPVGAATAWDHAASLADAARLLAWLADIAPRTEALGSEQPPPDPKEAWISRRPATGDTLVWVLAQNGTDGLPSGPGVTTWWHLGPAGPVELAHHDGLWIVAGRALWQVVPTSVPVVAPSMSGCRASSSVRAGLALVDALTGVRVELPFTGAARGGTLTVQHYEPGQLTVLEQAVNSGCAKASPVGVPRAVAVDSPAAAPPAWAQTAAPGAAGWSVVTEGSALLFAAFNKPSPPLAAPAVLPEATPG